MSITFAINHGVLDRRPRCLRQHREKDLHLTYVTNFVFNRQNNFFENFSYNFRSKYVYPIMLRRRCSFKIGHQSGTTALRCVEVEVSYVKHVAYLHEEKHMS